MSRKTIFVLRLTGFRVRSGVSALAAFFAGQFRDDESDIHLNDMVGQLSLIIGLPFSAAEHDDALTPICLLCLQRFSGFDSFKRVVVATLLPPLGRLAQDESFEFLAAAFLAAFGTDSDDFWATGIGRLGSC
jgi:hypothetical protein